MKTLIAWLAWLLTKDPNMTDTNQAADTSALAQVANSSAQSAAVVAATLEAQAAAAPSDVIGKLETILGALGYELPVFWGEAVALAKKVS